MPYVNENNVVNIRNIKSTKARSTLEKCNWRQWLITCYNATLTNTIGIEIYQHDTNNKE